MGPDGSAPQDAQAFIAALDEVDLGRYRVVGTYTRYDEAVRNALQDARQKILAGFEPPGRKRENHLIWAAPGTGKTYFVQQVAASLGDGVRYHEINLAKCGVAEFQAALGRLDDGKASLCLIDEVDAKPQEPWPYEVLLPYLDAAVERGARFVFVLAGSSGASLEEIKQRIAARPKGTDLLSRIPTGHEYVIGPMSLGDRLLIVLSQLRQAGQEAGRDIRAIEKLGLYYVALNPRLANARQLREFAVRAVERVPKTDDRVKYDHLFTPGDPENKAFWMQAQPVAEGLANTFAILTGDSAGARLANVATSAPPADAAVASHAVGIAAMEQQIRFCTTDDGVRIAYAAVGSGPLLVRAAHWMTHLEYDWSSTRRHFLEALTARCTLVRYDERGCGLSDWDVDTISFEAMIADLESVVDALHLDQFALLGVSQGGPVAIAYTVRHPEKVTRLVLHGTYARGWAKRSRAEREEHEAQLTMMKLGWDKDNPAYRQVFASLFMPDATAAQVREFNEWMRLTTPPENAARIQAAFGEIDVMDLAPKITIPTLVFHSRRDARCPFEEGRRVAALIPNAHFIPLESNNHMPQIGEPALEQMIAEIHRFLGSGDPPCKATRRLS